MKDRYFRSMRDVQEELLFNGYSYNSDGENIRDDYGISPEEVVNKLLEVVSNREEPLGVYGKCEKMYVSYGRLLEMIEEGYNIIRLLNPEEVRSSKIYIECQKCVKGKKYRR